ncbi:MULTISPECIES: transcriptional regulator GcvA [Corallincola]|uniref:Transcriptional regulator GcvA n=2 Tax=Corallincola TaxID=1775176 RepID=A0ABY1WN26_9GAMM|nr:MULTISPECIES: transcriptional regulator GcvA [Corallincola]TAA43737.1 transcriptional regulator GcvA [Corallincola spongiicola]TCI02984.1 transcriptional regulator GcvA [Corallincola luteus]
MSNKLPPLNAVKTFEAAARHLSFTRAAEELFVTQAAVSHQIKALESFLGVRLFRRAHRTLLLTEEGQSYFQTVSPLLRALSEATDRMMAMRASGALTVSLTPSFAISWLVPRLSEFSAKYPEIDVRIKAVDKESGPLDDDVDVAFFYGRGRWPGLESCKLHSEYRIPVCAPQLLQGTHPLKTPNDLQYYSLLHDGSRQDWKRWLRQASAKHVNANVGPIFSHSTMALQAAILGQGVALGHTTLARPDIESGRLVVPFKTAMLSRDSYFLVFPDEDVDNPKVVAFKAWVMERVMKEQNYLVGIQPEPMDGSYE